MPVIPPGISPYHIQPPCTMGDKGLPSSSITNDLQRVLNFIQDERHLTAHSLYTTILQRIQQYDDDNTTTHHNDEGDHSESGVLLNHTATTTTTTTTKNTIPKQKSKTTFASSYLKRNGSILIPKQSTTNGKHTNGTSSNSSSSKEDEEMKQVKHRIYSSKKHIFDTLEVRMSTYICIVQLDVLHW
jgi:hypothetical protein